MKGMLRNEAGMQDGRREVAEDSISVFKLQKQFFEFSIVMQLSTQRNMDILDNTM